MRLEIPGRYKVRQFIGWWVTCGLEHPGTAETMDVEELRSIMDLGKEMGLQGDDLSAFFIDEQAAARARQREEQERTDRE